MFANEPAMARRWVTEEKKMTQTRYGGNAEVGKAWVGKADPYSPSAYYDQPRRRGLSGEAKAAGAGLVVAGLGAREHKRAETAGDRAAARLTQMQAARDTSAANLTRAQTKHAETVAARGSQRKVHPTNWGQISRQKRRAARVDAAQLRLDRDEALLTRHTAAASPAGVARQSKLMRTTGKIGMGGGAAVVAGAGALKYLRHRDSRRQMATPQMVAKTITQSRWGGNAEAGRAWRGPEKKDRNRAADAAVGSAIVGGGGGIAAGLGARRLSKPSPAAALPELENVARTKDIASRRALVVTQNRRDLFEEGRAASEAGDAKRLRAMRARAGTAHRISDRAPRGVGVIGGSFVGHLERERDAAKAPAKAAYWERVGARADLARKKAQVAPDLAQRARAGKLVRRGGAVGALGAVGAVGAGLLAERGRKGPKRRRLSQVNAQARSATASPAQEHKPYKAGELDRSMEFAERQRRAKGLIGSSQ
jgi:hypothetical protein